MTGYTGGASEAAAPISICVEGICGDRRKRAGARTSAKPGNDLQCSSYVIRGVQTMSILSTSIGRRRAILQYGRRRNPGRAAMEHRARATGGRARGIAAAWWRGRWRRRNAVSTDREISATGATRRDAPSVADAIGRIGASHRSGRKNDHGRCLVMPRSRSTACRIMSGKSSHDIMR